MAAYELIGLARRMPFEAVLRMALVGRHERMSAERALALGMISQVVDPPERLREEAQALAEKIARNSPAAMAATKRALWGALEQGLTDACKAGGQELVSMWGHPDQAEGPLAFAEKREPRLGHDRGVRSELTGAAPTSNHFVTTVPAAELWRRAAVLAGIDATYGAPFGDARGGARCPTRRPRCSPRPTSGPWGARRGSPGRRRVLVARARSRARAHRRGGLGRGVAGGRPRLSSAGEVELRHQPGPG